MKNNIWSICVVMIGLCVGFSVSHTTCPVSYQSPTVFTEKRMCEYFTSNIQSLSCKCGDLCKVEDAATGATDDCLSTACAMVCAHVETCGNRKIYRFANCPAGFFYQTITDSCYRMVLNTAPLGSGYSAANAMCQLLHSNIVAIESSAENLIVENLLKTITAGSSGGSTCLQADIVFLLDSTVSVGADNFNIIKNFVKNVTDGLTIGENAVQVSVVLIDQDPIEIFPLNEHKNSTSFKQAMDNLAYANGFSTRTGEALAFIGNSSFTTAKGGRPGVADIVVVMTDGASLDPVQAESNQLHQAGVTVFAIGTQGASQSELAIIASDPDSSHVFNIADFNSLNMQLTSDLTRAICEASRAVWIGLTDFRERDQFHWMTPNAEKVETSNPLWALGEPSPTDQMAGKCCVRAELVSVPSNPTQKVARWSVTNCGMTLPVICETKPTCPMTAPELMCRSKATLCN